MSFNYEYYIKSQISMTGRTRIQTFLIYEGQKGMVKGNECGVSKS